VIQRVVVVNKKIIAFSSTHGTGKSSLAYMLAAKMKLAGSNVVVLDELARKCPFPINKDADERTQIWIMLRQALEEIELVDKVDYLIVDRGIYDGYFYDRVVNNKVTLCDHFLGYASVHASKYYKKIYVPDKDSFNFQIADGVRDMEKAFRDDVYEMILNCYHRWNLHREDDNKIPYKIIHSAEEVYEDLGV
jgi:hypothetical protein